MVDTRRYLLIGLSLILSMSVLTTSSHSSSESTYTSTLDLPAHTCVFSGAFEQNLVLDSLATPLRSNGLFFYHCKHGVIWSTQTPIAETLVLKRDGSGFVVKNSQSKKLRSRQSKFLGSLLNDLMGSDPASIESQFNIERLDPDLRKYHLIPKKRAIKRRIKGITISLPNDKMLDQNPVVIKISDRNTQQTEIQSTRNNVFPINDDPAKACHDAAGITQRSCSLLLGFE